MDVLQCQTARKNTRLAPNTSPWRNTVWYFFRVVFLVRGNSVAFSRNVADSEVALLRSSSSRHRWYDSRSPLVGREAVRSMLSD